MSRISSIFTTVLAITLFASCATTYVKPTDASQTDFSVSFFKAVNSLTPKNENVVVSPYSAAVALSMLTEGAHGDTRAELEKALAYNFYRSESLGSNDTVVVKSANSIWIDNDFSPHNRYVSLLQKDYDAFLDVEDFSSPVAVEAINNWCSENTNGKITEILEKLDPSNVMVLVNALYFNAPWKIEFDPARTTEQTFKGISGDSTVKMMSNLSSYIYGEYNGIQMIQLPYEGLRYSMYVILPPEGEDVDKLIKMATPAAFNSALGMLSEQEVRLLLPRFKVETSMLLNQSLQKMGIKTAFTSMADFSGIAQMGPLVLDQVRQKCYVDVTETGTEAAAVTSIQVRLTSVRPVKQVQVMRVDRPFIFVIADGDNNNILFAGKIVDL